MHLAACAAFVVMWQVTETLDMQDEEASDDGLYKNRPKSFSTIHACHTYTPHISALPFGNRSSGQQYDLFHCLTH